MASSITEYKLNWSENSAASISRAPLVYSTVHMHNFFEMEFALSGSVNHIINNQVTTFGSGDIWLISPTTVHHFYGDIPHPGVDRYILRFEPTFISSTVWKAVDVQSIPLCIHLEGAEFDILQNMFHLLLSYANNQVLPRTEFVKWTLEWIILHLFEKHFLSKATPVLSLLQPALVYIQTHFRENITINEVADAVHFSAEHFSRLFHKNIGMSYKDYILNLRLTHAYSILYAPNIKIGEACFQSGFNSPEYFSRAFKKKFGISPLQHYLDKNPDKQRKAP